MNKKNFTPYPFLISTSVLLIFAAVLMISCSSPPVDRNYYIIDYSPRPQNPNLVLDQALPYRVEVSNTRISRIYDRTQIVYRYSPHKIEYANNELWAVRLSSAIPDAITNHLIRYNTFATTQRDFLIERPEYEVVTIANQLEMLRSDYFFGAHLSMDIFLRHSDDMDYVVRHSFSRELEIFTDNVEVFVQQVSNIIKEETDQFIEKTLRHFNEFTDADILPVVAIEDTVTVEPDERRLVAPSERLFGLTDEQVETWLMPPPREQLIRESKRDLVGLGRVFLPAMSSTDAEPFYTLYSPTEYTNYFEKMGASIFLSQGDYILQYGSGAEHQKMSQEITVLRDQTHIIEPDWGGLRVRVIDENRNTIDSQYELFMVSSAESFGYGKGALEEFGEQLQTWILKPATYKIVLNNRPFNTLEDFFTIDVVRGELRIITLVIDSETNNLKGAGILEGMEHTRELRDWRFSSAIHGSFNLNVDNLADRVLYTLDTQLDNRLNYDKDPYYFTSHNLIDMGIRREGGEDFRISADSFKLRNTFVYYLSRFIGIYGRADLETHLFEENLYYSNDRNFMLVESDENDNKFIRTLEGKNQLRVKPPFFPLILREGAGLNFRPLNRPRASLNLRTGLGFRQTINHNVYSYDFTVIDTLGTTFHRHKAIDSDYSEGLEFSVLLNLHLPFNVRYNTTGDILVPFYSSGNVSYNWENTFTIRFIRQAAIDYKINISYPVMDETEVTHNVYLRVTYFLY